MVDFQAYRSVTLKEMLQTGGGAAGGLTVRDYFAAAALQQMIASPNVEFVPGEPTAVTIARLSYKLADAMMQERNKRPEEPAPTVEEAFGLQDSDAVRRNLEKTWGKL